MKYGRVIVPLDGSLLSECALPLACALAERMLAEVMLARATDGDGASPAAQARPVLAGGTGGLLGSSPAGGRTAVAGPPRHGVEETRRYLDQIAAGLASGEAVVAVRALAGEPAQAVLGLAEREHADLIVMATHGRSGLARSVLGSVTDRVALHSSVPVLVVRPSCAPGARPDLVTVRSVLVPLDQSELSESAISHAVAVADAFHARLTLLSVTAPWGSRPEAAAAMQYLTGVAGRLALPEGRVGVVVASGNPGSVIAGQLALLPDAMVVMTTRGASGLRRWIRGSVTDAVIRAGLAPTMVVPPVGPLLGPAIH